MTSTVRKDKPDIALQQHDPIRANQIKLLWQLSVSFNNDFNEARDTLKKEALINDADSLDEMSFLVAESEQIGGGMAQPYKDLKNYLKQFRAVTAHLKRVRDEGYIKSSPRAKNIRDKLEKLIVNLEKFEREFPTEKYITGGKVEFSPIFVLLNKNKSDEFNRAYITIGDAVKLMNDFQKTYASLVQIVD